MFNPKLGTRTDNGGVAVITTKRGAKGHVVFGPYAFHEAGAYSVEFRVRLDEKARWRADAVCAVLDVTRNGGDTIVVSRSVRLSELRAGHECFRLDFRIEARGKLEYRIWTSGAVALSLDEHRRLVREDAAQDAEPRFGRTRALPDRGEGGPPFFDARYQRFREFYDQGFGIDFLGEDAVVSRDGLAVYVRSDDDFTFLGEIFRENVYNVLVDGDLCVVDIGMNIGLSTLQFARKPNVREVHSFEPFPETYARAVANIGLNAGLSAKIAHRCLGLSDRNWSGEIRIDPARDSGSNTVVATAGTQAVTIALADAGEVLRPIIEGARGHGRRIVLKVDCEGSEFAIFRALEKAGLLARVDALMVEWHAMFDDVDQTDLIAPLRAAGFIVFDRSPPSGNGFFYAVRLSGAGGSAR